MASDPRRPFTVAELFCGCGGFSHGFWRSSKFRIVLGNDIKPEALRTFKFNHTKNGFSPVTLRPDIRILSIDEIVSALASQGIRNGELDCLIGGPPCQGFSQMKRSEERQRGKIVRFKGYNRLAHDHRNDLVLRFLEIAATLNPKVILIENVPQMLRHGFHGVEGGLKGNVEVLLREMGYSTVVDKVNAADYGVPQLRERAIFLASRIGRIDFPQFTHVDPSAPKIISGHLPHWRTVKDAIADLPFDPPLGEDSFAGQPLSMYNDVRLSDYATYLRTSSAFPPNHLTRTYGEKVLSIVRHMKPGETWDDESQRIRAKYKKVIAKNSKRGESEGKARERLIKGKVLNAVFYRRYYWSAYTRLDWNRPALTITANSNFLGSGRFTHPDRDRGITMREAARLQSFDDNFRFITDSEDERDTTNIGIGLDMIGEAVPPLLGEAFASKIARALETYYRKDEPTGMVEEQGLGFNQTGIAATQ
jgi:DNA (cytosine-5)-methyltransferase 1